MTLSRNLTDEEKYLYALLSDESGLDLGEFYLPDETSEDLCYRAWDFQWVLWRKGGKFIADKCGRGVGKSEGVRLRSFAFPFNFPGHELMITAPELNHLRLLTDKIEYTLLYTRLGREMRPAVKGHGINHQPQFQCTFINGSKIISRLPNTDGRGVKGAHPLRIEMDEAQNYPKGGWVEIIETMKTGNPKAQWRAHGVPLGTRDMFYTITMNEDPNLPFMVHSYIASHRPDWSDEERNRKVALYGGSEENIDYRRNIFGDHGDAYNPIFVLARLMACFHSETLVWVLVDGQVISKRIVDVAVGERVLNATGWGRVEATASKQVDRMAAVRVKSHGGHGDGEVLYCTPEHLFLTLRGWVPAVELREDDRLVSAGEMSDLWGSRVGARSDLLLDGVPSQQGGEGLPDLWGGDIAGCEVLRLRVQRQGEADSATVGGVSVLREAVGRQRSDQVLLSGLQEGRAGEASRTDDDVRAVRAGLHFSAEQALLLGGVCREVGWDELPWLGYSETDIQHMRAVWQSVLPSIQEGAVLQPEVLGGGDSGGSTGSPSDLQALRYVLHSNSQRSEVLRTEVLAGGEERTAGELGWAVGSSVRALAGAWGGSVGVAAGVLGLSAGGGRRGGPLLGGSGQSASDGGRGGGWGRTPRACDSGQGSASGRLVAFSRVESVEVLERGSDEFDRLSGGEDQVRVIDLSVSGHPSFAVGQSQLLVHNCVRMHEDSWAARYNESVYHKVQITDESLRKEDGLIETFLMDIPGSHLAEEYTSFWAGMDIGFTDDPSEILLFGQVARKGLPDLQRLLLRVQMRRIGASDQIRVMRLLFETYGERLRRFGMDRTGVGLPLLQVMQQRIEDGEVGYKPIMDRLVGYGFSQKVPVAFDDRKPEGNEQPEDLVIMKNIKEHTTDLLRMYVDETRIELPYDKTLLDEWQGAGVVAKRTASDGVQRSYTGGNHTLDAARMMAAAKDLMAIEEALKPRHEEVLDAFL